MCMTTIADKSIYIWVWHCNRYPSCPAKWLFEMKWGQWTSYTKISATGKAGTGQGRKNKRGGGKPIAKGLKKVSWHDLQVKSRLWVHCGWVGVEGREKKRTQNQGAWRWWTTLPKRNCHSLILAGPTTPLHLPFYLPLEVSSPHQQASLSFLQTTLLVTHTSVPKLPPFPHVQLVVFVGAQDSSVLGTSLFRNWRRLVAYLGKALLPPRSLIAG